MAQANQQQQQQQQHQHHDMMIEQQDQFEEHTAAASSSIFTWQTMIREVLIQPYLPPPVIRFIQMIDTFSYNTYGISEATVTILFTLLIAYMIRYMIQILLFIVTNRHGRAIKDDDNDDKTMKKVKQDAYDTTVLFTGPRNSGKTTLFYQFVYNMEGTTSNASDTNTGRHDVLPTVMSLRPNIGYVINETADSTNNYISDKNNNNKQQQPSPHHQKIRCIDYPGYMNIYDTTYNTFIIHNKNHPSLSSSSSPTRIVLVVDATQSVTTCAEILFHLFTILYNSYCTTTNDNKSTKKKEIVTMMKSSIFVACHKQDHSKAKNEKRIKIQLRTELERLIYNTTVQQQQQQQQMSKQQDNDNSSSNKSTTATTTNNNNNEYWWNCTSTRNSNNSSTTTTTKLSSSSLSLQQFTINVDFDELDFIHQIYFYPTSSVSSSSSSNKELYEFCTTGMVQQQ
jgi:hypothetical protein